MSSIATSFQFNNRQLSVITIDDTPWFVLREVCGHLTIANPSKAAAQLDEDEKRLARREDEIYGYILKLYPLSSNAHTLWLINESGLYSLAIRSNKPEAKAFRKWVTSEVLPSIRKTGKYEIESIPQETDPIMIAGTMITALRKEQLALEHKVDRNYEDLQNRYDELYEESLETKQQLADVAAMGTKAGRTPGSRPQMVLDVARMMINTSNFDEPLINHETSYHEIQHAIIEAVRPKLPAHLQTRSAEELLSYQFVYKLMSDHLRSIVN